MNIKLCHPSHPLILPFLMVKSAVRNGPRLRGLYQKVGKERRKEGKKEKRKREKHLSSENVDSGSTTQRKVQAAIVHLPITLIR